MQMATKSTTAVAILTSGGDSQGMNCVLYGLLKAAANTRNNGECHCTEVYFVHDGYLGLVNGGPKYITLVNMESVARVLHRGGTLIGSSRCAEFRTIEGRKRAAQNLIKLGIGHLVVVGGDGSLTGANQLRQEWPSFVEQFKAEKSIDTLMLDRVNSLTIVGLVGSIDNDFYGTHMTIGADSALCRIVESIDTLSTTAASHHRTMVIEVMGRACGYLALSSALATEASYTFLPECPHRDTGEWQRKLRARITLEESHDQRHHIVIVAEGACDANGMPIKADAIREFCSNELKLDTRTVILGHTQRGGNTSAFDRLMSIQMGIEAFNLVTTGDNSESLVITFEDGAIRTRPLMHCIAQCNALAEHMRAKRWNEVVTLRGTHFVDTWNQYRQLMSDSSVPTTSSSPSPTQMAWAVVHIGTRPIAGMNGIAYALVHYAHSIANTIVYGALNGVDGLIQDQFELLTWQMVTGLTATAGSILGVGNNDNIFTTDQVKKIIQNITNRHISALCVVGDYQAYTLVRTLEQYNCKLKLCFIPATFEPKEELLRINCKLGHDSVLNKLFDHLTDLRLSTTGACRTVLLVKLPLTVANDNVFLQPTLFALANTAVHCYPSDRAQLHNSSGGKVTLACRQQMEQEALQLREQILKQSNNSSPLSSSNQHIILIHEPLFGEVYETYLAIFSACISPIQVVAIDLCYLSQPSHCSPFDRKLAVKLGMGAGAYFASSSTSASISVSQTGNKTISGSGSGGGSMLLTAPSFDLVPL